MLPRHDPDQGIKTSSNGRQMNKTSDPFDAGKHLIPLGSRFVPMSEGELRAIEHEVGATLPSAYRAFAQRYGASMTNGLTMFSSIVHLPEYITKDGWALFGSFFGASSEEYDGANSLAWNVENYRDRIPAWLLPIGDDDGSDVICLAVSGRNRGKVFFWDARQEMGEQEKIELGAPDRHKNIYLVADSFDEFLHRLRVTPERL